MHVCERGAVVTQNCSARRTRRPVSMSPVGHWRSFRSIIPRSRSSWLTSKAGIPSGGRGSRSPSMLATRMVTGFYLSLEPPSRASIGLCLLHAVYDKTAWLAERGIEDIMAGGGAARHASRGQWCGLPQSHLHPCLSGGGDPRIISASQAATLRRPHPERLIGTKMGAVHLLPGTTFSHPGKRGDYSSSRAAMMTLHELERWIAWEIAGHYHQRIHASLHRPPIAVWKDGEALRHLRLPTDRMKFWVSFPPDDERTLQRDGIHFCNIRYWADALAAENLGRTKGKVLIKYDPRDLSRGFLSAGRQAGLSRSALSQSRLARDHAVGAEGRDEVSPGKRPRLRSMKR